jgi:hypothetical protein
MLEAVITILGVTITLLQCFDKWGWLDYYEFSRATWMPEGGCFLCLSFWLSIPVSFLYYVLWLYGAHWLLIPLTVAGIINILITIQRK